MAFNESDRGPQEPKPSAQQLNLQFRQLLEQIPVNSPSSRSPEDWEGSEGFAFNMEPPVDELMRKVQHDIIVTVKDFLRRKSIINRRKASTHGDLLIQGVRNLLGSSVTEACQDFIGHQVQNDYVRGRDSDGSLSPLNIQWALDLDYPFGGGLFDRTRAEALEPIGYAFALRRIEEFRSKRESSTIGGRDDWVSSMENFIEGVTNRWPAEYLQHYGKPLLPPTGR